MLALTFQVGQERFALEVNHVAALVPRVPLRPAAGAPPWLAGVFVYRGTVVPVIDLHRFLGAGECPPHLSSRIILVLIPGADDGRLAGLLAGRVDSLLTIDTPAGQHTALPGCGELGPVVTDESGVIRLLDVERLLPESFRSSHTLAAEAPP